MGAASKLVGLGEVVAFQGLLLSGTCTWGSGMCVFVGERVCLVAEESALADGLQVWSSHCYRAVLGLFLTALSDCSAPSRSMVRGAAVSDAARGAAPRLTLHAFFACEITSSLATYSS